MPSFSLFCPFWSYTRPRRELQQTERGLFQLDSRIYGYTVLKNHSGENKDRVWEGNWWAKWLQITHPTSPFYFRRPIRDRNWVIWGEPTRDNTKELSTNVRLPHDCNKRISNVLRYYITQQAYQSVTTLRVKWCCQLCSYVLVVNLWNMTCSKRETIV